MQSLADIVYRYIHRKSLHLTIYAKNRKIFPGVTSCSQAQCKSQSRHDIHPLGTAPICLLHQDYGDSK